MSRKLWWDVKYPCNASASQSRLPRSRPRARAARAATSCCPGGHPADIRADSRELDVGVRQDRLPAVDDPGSVLPQRRAVVGELPELPWRFGRRETAPQEAMAQKLRHLFGVLDVRFPPRHGLGMLGIDHQQFNQPFEPMVDRTPIDTRAFHDDVGAGSIDTPVIFQGSRRRRYLSSVHGEKGFPLR